MRKNLAAFEFVILSMESVPELFHPAGCSSMPMPSFHAGADRKGGRMRGSNACLKAVLSIRRDIQYCTY